MKIGTAMLLAAGLGTRMRPLTEKMPKPLVPVAGKALIDHAMDRLRAHGVCRAVVNVHWLADQLEEWAAHQQPPPEVVISDERAQLLETGGGIRHALPLLGMDAPFFAINTDSIWLDAPNHPPALQRLQEAWDDARMDALLLLADPQRSTGYHGAGDFILQTDGRLQRRVATTDAGTVKTASAALPFTGIYVVHPRLFEAAPDAPAFSMNVLFDAALAQGRLFGIAHDGWWLHVGEPEAIGAAEEVLSQHAGTSNST